MACYVRNKQESNQRHVNLIKIKSQKKTIYNSVNIVSRTGIKRFHAISYTWYGLIAVAVAIIVGIVVSLLTSIFYIEIIEIKIVF